MIIFYGPAKVWSLLCLFICDVFLSLRGLPIYHVFETLPLLTLTCFGAGSWLHRYIMIYYWGISSVLTRELLLALVDSFLPFIPSLVLFWDKFFFLCRLGWTQIQSSCLGTLSTGILSSLDIMERVIFEYLPTSTRREKKYRVGKELRQLLS